MKKRHYTQIANWLRKRPAAAIGLAAIVCITGRAIWFKARADSRPIAVPVTYADSPDSEPRPPAAAVSAVITPLPSVEYNSSSSVTPVPVVEAGPELFGQPRKPSVVSIAMTDAAPKPAADPRPASGCPGCSAAAMRLPPAIATAAPPPVKVTQPAPPIAPLPPRSEALEMIARQADETTREGMDLADRGASFAARADFIAALRLVAQGLDNDEAGARHSHALSAALNAMKEAQDFLPAAGKTEGELDIPSIVAGHATPLLKNSPPAQLQAMRALKQYFNFAQEQLRLAVGHEVAGSMALGALGKLHASMAEKGNSEMPLPEAKAITFYQAAVLVCPQNYVAANDLGVLWAHKNDYAAARSALEHSVTVCRTVENLKNLSVVYRHLGEARLGDLAAQDAESAKVAEATRQRSGSRSAGGAVQWVGPEALPAPSAQWADVPARPAAPAGTSPAPTTANAAAGQPAAMPAASVHR
jgi:tetratricopeptide (TPR) repeat protein